MGPTLMLGCDRRAHQAGRERKERAPAFVPRCRRITTLPTLAQVLDGKVTVSQIRELAPEDVLARAGFRATREAGAFDGRPIGQGDRYLIAAERIR